MVASWQASGAVKVDGSVATWGDSVGFVGESNGEADSSDVAAQLSGGVLSVVGNRGAFALVNVGGSVLTWGRAEFGGD